MMTSGAASLARTRLPGVHHQRAGAPADRRGDRRVLQLHLRVLDRRAIGAHGRLERRGVGVDLIDLLARRDARAPRGPDSGPPDASAFAACARSRASVACACCSAASSGRRSSVKSTWPFFTSSPSRKRHRVELAGELRVHRHVRIGLGRADDADVDRHRLLDDRRDRHRDGRLPRAATAARRLGVVVPARMAPPNRREAAHARCDIDGKTPMGPQIRS